MPPAFVAGQLKGMVGLKIPIGRIEGKVGRNRSAADRAGVEAGLADAGDGLLSTLVARGGPSGWTSAQ